MNDIVAFDFDGVLHKSIQKTDSNGQRHPEHSMTYDKLIKFDKIMKYIYILRRNGSQIEILSSRKDTKVIQEFIKNNNVLNHVLLNTGITIISTAGASKSSFIFGKNISSFYDDSASVLKEVLSEKISRGIFNPRIFYVVPEFDDWYEVTTEKEIDDIFLKLQIYLLAKESYKLNNSGGNKTEYNTLKGLIKVNKNVNMSSSLKSSSTKRTINIYGTIFSPGSPSTDFREILKILGENKLFIYNENFNHYNDKNNLSQGAGNGFLRQYRLDNIQNLSKPEPKIKSFGIPTANHVPNGSEKISTVIESIEQIKNFIETNKNITDIYYSAEDSSMKLGLSIFRSNSFAKANIGEISRLLNNMFFELSKTNNVTLYQLTYTGIIQIPLNQK